MKITKRLTLILVVILILSILCACGNSEKNERIRESTDALITGIITDNFELYSSVMAESIPHNDMISAFNQVQLYMDGATEFTLTQVGSSSEFSNGIGSYTVTYLVKTNVGDFYVNAMELSSAAGISAFGISRAENSSLSLRGFGPYTVPIMISSLIAAVLLIVLAVCLIRRKKRSRSAAVRTPDPYVQIERMYRM